MKTILSVVLTPIFFIFFGLGLLVFHPVQVIARNLFGAKAHDKSVVALNLYLMRTLWILGTGFRFINFKKLPTDTPLIILSNHQSMWDIPTLMWKFRKHRPKFIAKKELAKNIPSISYNLKYGGSVSIDRNKPEEAIRKIKAFAQNIQENNFAVCIFPEGTRSRNGKTKPFKVSGAKALLAEMPEALFVPVAIKNTGKIDNDGKFLKNLGVKVSYTMLEPRRIELDSFEKELEKMHDEIKLIVES